LVLQVSSKLLNALFDGCMGEIRFLCRNDSLAPQKLHELFQRGSVAGDDTFFRSAMSQVLRRMLPADLFDVDSFSPEPLAKTRRQEDSTMYVLPHIFLLKRPLPKPVGRVSQAVLPVAAS